MVQYGTKEENRTESAESTIGAPAIGRTQTDAGTLGSGTPTLAAPRRAPIAASSASIPETWHAKADVLVVGSGCAGLCAAIEAAGAGAKVLVIEKGPRVGGQLALSGGHIIVGATHVQHGLGIADSLEWWYEDEMKMSDYRAVPELVRTYVERGPDTVLWLEQLGVRWLGRMVGYCPGHRVDRSHYPAPSRDYPGGWPAAGGLAITLMLLRAAETRGVSVLLNHRMTHILRPDPSGPVLGIEAVTEDKPLKIRAGRGIVLASGGFASNARMCMAWDPRLGPDLFASGLPYVEVRGEGLVAALDVGAELTDMSFVCFLPIKWGSKVYQLWEPAEMTTVPQGRTGLPLTGEGFQRVLLVENNGRRYVNEAEGAVPGNAEYPEQPFTAAFLELRERPRNVWAVTDAQGAQALRWSLEIMTNPNPHVLPALYPDCVAVANDLQALAAKMGVPPGNLEDTVRRYNGFVDAGHDDDFGKPKPLYRISQLPFVGARLCMMRHSQCGGIRTNTKAQVLARSDEMVRYSNSIEGVSRSLSIDQEPVIPRLYAAGECTGSLGWRRTHGKLGIYAAFGRIAGKHAAKEEPWE